MALAFNWVKHSTPLANNILSTEIPYLDYGPVAPGMWSQKHIVALHFQGQSITDLQIMMEDVLSDRYLRESDEANVNYSLNNYIFKAIVLADDGSNLSIYNSSPDNWPITLPSQQIQLNNVAISVDFDGYSQQVALCVYVPDNETDAELVNFRLVSSFNNTSE